MYLYVIACTASQMHSAFPTVGLRIFVMTRLRFVFLSNHPCCFRWYFIYPYYSHENCLPVSGRGGPITRVLVQWLGLVTDNPQPLVQRDPVVSGPFFALGSHVPPALPFGALSTLVLSLPVALLSISPLRS